MELLYEVSNIIFSVKNFLMLPKAVSYALAVTSVQQ